MKGIVRKCSITHVMVEADGQSSVTIPRTSIVSIEHSSTRSGWNNHV